MENVILVVHLILAFALIGVVLLQRSEGSALLSGGGQMSGRSKITGIAKLTWALAIAFIATSVALTIVAAANSQGSSVVDGVEEVQPAAEDAELPLNGLEGDLLPPAEESTPPRAD